MSLGLELGLGLGLGSGLGLGKKITRSKASNLDKSAS